MTDLGGLVVDMWMVLKLAARLGGRKLAILLESSRQMTVTAEAVLIDREGHQRLDIGRKTVGSCFSLVCQTFL